MVSCFTVVDPSFRPTWIKDFIQIFYPYNPSGKPLSLLEMSGRTAIVESNALHQCFLCWLFPLSSYGSDRKWQWKEWARRMLCGIACLRQISDNYISCCRQGWLAYVQDTFGKCTKIKGKQIIILSQMEIFMKNSFIVTHKCESLCTHFVQFQYLQLQTSFYKFAAIWQSIMLWRGVAHACILWSLCYLLW